MNNRKPWAATKTQTLRGPSTRCLLHWFIILTAVSERPEWPFSQPCDVFTSSSSPPCDHSSSFHLMLEGKTETKPTRLRNKNTDYCRCKDDPSWSFSSDNQQKQHCSTSRCSRWDSEVVAHTSPITCVSHTGCERRRALIGRGPACHLLSVVRVTAAEQPVRRAALNWNRHLKGTNLIQTLILYSASFSLSQSMQPCGTKYGSLY